MMELDFFNRLKKLSNFQTGKNKDNDNYKIWPIIYYNFSLIIEIYIFSK